MRRTGEEEVRADGRGSCPPGWGCSDVLVVVVVVLVAVVVTVGAVVSVEQWRCTISCARRTGEGSSCCSSWVLVMFLLLL